MRRVNAVVIIILFFLVTFLIFYYGNNLTFSSSCVMTALLSLIITFFVYPLNQLVDELPDFSLGIYVALVIIFLAILFIYILYRALPDFRTRRSILSDGIITF